MADALVRIQLGPILSDCFGYFLSAKRCDFSLLFLLSRKKISARADRISTNNNTLMLTIGASRKLAMI